MSSSLMQRSAGSAVAQQMGRYPTLVMVSYDKKSERLVARAVRDKTEESGATLFFCVSAGTRLNLGIKTPEES